MEQLSIEEEETKSNCFQTIASHFLFIHLRRFFTNLVKFILALWTIADMALDVKTTHFYYQRSFAFNDNINLNDTITVNNTITIINDTITFNDTITANNTSQVSIESSSEEL